MVQANLDKEDHYQLKLMAAKRNITIKKLVHELVMRELEVHGEVKS